MSEGFQDTPKQREIMQIVLSAADAGGFIGLRELHAALSYGAMVSNQAVQCSMRFLIKNGLVTRYSEKGRTYYKPTPYAYRRYRKP